MHVAGQDFYARNMPNENAGLAVNLTEKAVRQQMKRLVQQFQPPGIGAPVPPRFGGIVRWKCPPAYRRTEIELLGMFGRSYREPLRLAFAGTSSSDGGMDLVRTTTTRALEERIKESREFLIAADYDISLTPELGDVDARRAVVEEVDELIGMDRAKSFFKDIEDIVKYVEQGGNMNLLKTSLNMVITGNPGTGKTTVARLIARYLHAFGVLPNDRFVEKNGLDLKGKFVGHTSHVVREAILSAMGGCLFIDEAYALADAGGDSFSGEAVRTLLTEVENNRR
jgi:hypothetical protein